MGANTHVIGISFCRYANRMSTAVPNVPEKVPGISGASYVMRKELLEQAGGAPEECFVRDSGAGASGSMNDDVVLSWTLNLMGYDLYCIPQSVMYHDYQLVLDPVKYFGLSGMRNEPEFLKKFRLVDSDIADFLICLRYTESHII